MQRGVDRDDPQDARRRHRCGLRTARGPGHRPHHRAARLENLRACRCAHEHSMASQSSPSMPARGLCHRATAASALKQRRSERGRGQDQHPARHSPTCSRATTRSRGRNSSARSSRIPRTPTCTPASACCTTAPANRSSPTSISAKRCELAPDKSGHLQQLRHLPLQERARRRRRGALQRGRRQQVLPHARSGADQRRRVPARRQASRRGAVSISRRDQGAA